MWSRTARATSRSARLWSHQPRPFARSYNGANQGPPKTYFQVPQQSPPRPRRRFLRSFLLGTTFFVFGFYGHAYLHAKAVSLGMRLDHEEDLPVLEEALAAGAADAQAKTVHPFTVEEATAILHSRAGYSVTPGAVSHTCQSASNIPCEDTWSSGTFPQFNDPARDWSEWAIFDGHAGPRTSHALKEFLPGLVGERLLESESMTRSYVPNDVHIHRTIQNAFRYLDETVFGEAAMELRAGKRRRADIISLISNSLSGSCALMAILDPANDVLRVANTGDSRAVLGRWANGKYSAQAMSSDHTGFNQDEVERLRREHPGEEVIDEKTGRIFGLAVTRAFGDSRWKWSEELTRKAHEMFFGPAPRPKGVVKTPPYLTAEPEIKETKIQTGAHPDFLIMASDGLWDLMSNEDAVMCVQMWLEKHKPADFINNNDNNNGLESKMTSHQSLTEYMTPSDNTPDKDDDTYYDADEKCLKWRVSPKHFVVEDEHAGVHLIKNALGGSRRRLFEAVMSIQPPLSRNVRDDITVHVIFFGVDTGEAVKELADLQAQQQAIIGEKR
jgi:pyruvate dehydrogenase phosphatase